MDEWDGAVLLRMRVAMEVEKSLVVGFRFSKREKERCGKK